MQRNWMQHAPYSIMQCPIRHEGTGAWARRGVEVLEQKREYPKNLHKCLH